MITRACISINARCNLSCKYCHFGKKVNTLDFKAFEMTREDIKVILTNVSNYIKSNNIEQFKIGLVGSGEPFLSFEAIEEAVLFAAKSEQRIKYYTITNGTILNKDQLDFFYKYKDFIDLNVSLDGPKDIHEVVREGFDKTFKNIIEFEKLFGHKPTINAVVTRLTISNQERVVDFFLENGFKNVNFSIVFGDYTSGVAISKEEYYRFLKYAKEKGLNMRQMSGEKKYDSTKYGNLCAVGRNNIYITKKGVFPCGRFQNKTEYLIGEFDSPLEKIEETMKKFINPDPTTCYYEAMQKENKV